MNIKEAIKLLKENKYIVERNTKFFYDNIQDEMNPAKIKPEGLSAENPITDRDRAYDSITELFIKERKPTVVCYCNAGHHYQPENWTTYMKDPNNNLYLALTVQDYKALVDRLNILFHAETSAYLPYHTKGYRYDFFLLAKSSK